MYFILQVCKVEEKDLEHHCDVGKSFKYFVNGCSLQGAKIYHTQNKLLLVKILIL